MKKLTPGWYPPSKIHPVRALSLVLCLLTTALFHGCDKGSDRDERVLLIGIDGASSLVMGPLLAQGELPNLEAIARRGVLGHLIATKPLTSPRIWNTIATGKNPEAHGILGFGYQVGAGQPRLYMSTDRKTHALWNIASSAGLEVAVINFWNTYPPEEIRGVMVSDHVLPSAVKSIRETLGAAEPDVGPIIFPEKWTMKLTAMLNSDKRATDFPDPLADNERFPPWNRDSGARLTRRTAEDDALVRMALSIEKELHPDLMMILLPGIDRVSHHLWGALEPENRYPENLRMTPEQREAAADALRNYYRYTDALIGKLVEPYGPGDLVLIMSDHGFEAGMPKPYLTGTHKTDRAAKGVFLARGRDITLCSELQSVSAADITPLVLTWLGLPAAEDMDGEPVSFLETQPKKNIPTYDTEPVERVSTTAPGAESEYLERLKSLGYIY